MSTAKRRRRSPVPPPEQWASLPRSNRDAERVGADYYFTGKPCPNGHMAPRTSGRKRCVECQYENSEQAAKDATIDVARSRCSDLDLLALPRSAAEARRLGERFYFTGLPCVGGHVTRSYAHNNTCAACTLVYSEEHLERGRPEREAAAEAKRLEWEAGRPAREEARRIKEEAEKPARLAAQREAFRQRMVEEGTELVRAEGAERAKRDYWADPEKGRARTAVRRAQGLISSIYPNFPSVHELRRPPWQTDEERAAIEAFYDACPDGHEVDHIVPFNHLQHGNRITGLHTLANLQYLTPAQNRSGTAKGSRLPDPSNYKIACKRPLTDEELQGFVQREMAAWSDDWNEDGGTIRWWD